VKISFKQWGVAAILAAMASAPALAEQAFPERPLRIVVPFTAGGGTDTITRLVAQRMSTSMGQPIIVENKPGASTMIGTELVAKAEPDGYTMLITIPSLVQAPALYSNVPYDPIRDFTPITTVVSAPLWLAVNTERVPGKDLKEFIDFARKNPGKLEYASFGNGSTSHLFGFHLTDSAELQLTHVPYKGGAQAVTALLSGEVAAMLSDYATLRAHEDSGKIRIIAVSGPERVRQTPNVPTLLEEGYKGFESVGWGGLFVPSKTPTDRVQRLSKEVSQALADPQVSGKLNELGYNVGGEPQEQFAATVKADYERWTDMIKRAGVKID
jgi:tripartite-type tricarboxylate transporter receptor subunit TctC